ncbi:MAG: carboxypeptidase-like regulatory domain-containing protein [Prevotella sp.]|nr:carboxypeptidase-like regulatory domain-containing protein [Prevotella sp.]
MKRYLLLFLCFVGTTLPLVAQTQIKGTVTDSLTGQPLAKANVMLLSNGKTVRFVRTDDKGNFTIALPPSMSTASVELQATSMGYEKKRQRTDQANHIRLVQKAFEMQEVVVRAGPVTARKDTVTYDLTRYATERDNSLKDVLKKLPGVKIAGNGQISVNGKNISRLTVEGLDLSNGKYNKLTDNIKAKDVKKAEVIEHDQPIKALRNKVFSDNIAMNVVLKDSARDQLSVTLRPYLLAGKPTHAAGSGNAMQIGKRKQVMYEAEYDRSGKDIAQSGTRFYYNFMAPQTAKLPNWHAVVSLDAPISDTRMRFNTSQDYSVNRVTKTKDDAEIRLNAEYVREVVRQHKVNRSQYHLEGTPVNTEEQSDLTLKQDRFDFSINKKLNNENSFGDLELSIDAAQSDALSLLNSTGHGETGQQVRNPEINLSGHITNTRTRQKGTFSWSSILDYHHSRNDLYIGNNKESLNNNLWHTQHEAAWRTRSRYLTQSYTARLSAEHLNVKHNDAVVALNGSPSWTYEKGKWRITYAQGLQLKHYTRLNEWAFLLSPSLYANFKKSSKTETSASLSYSQSASGLQTFALDRQRLDYRTMHIAPDFLPRTNMLFLHIDHGYKRVTREFFINMQLNASRTWSNSVMDMRIENGNYLYTYTKHDTQNNSMNGSFTVSKGFYDIHLKTALTVSGTYSSGEQYSKGHVTSYNYRQAAFSPTVTFSPDWMQLDYEGNFSLGQSRTGNVKMTTLFNWRQSLTLTSTIHKVDVSLSGILYHNELQASPSVNTFLADAKVVWRLKPVRLTATLSNLLGKRTYALTTYSGVGVYTNEYELRPRELKISAEFSL